MSCAKRVSYVCDEDFVRTSDKFIPTKHRNTLVHELIKASGLLEKMTVIKPTPACADDMQLFHDGSYVRYLMKDRNKLCSFEDQEEDEGHGFGYDCPLVNGLSYYCQMVAGGSLTAADKLSKKECDIAIHWLGGWHHAKRNEASGYCYVNDCVLAISKLRQVFSKVLYVDLDLHHGDGVQDAFYATNKVLTYSVHKFEPGFFPGTGGLWDVGFGKGLYHSVNVPLKDGIQDEKFYFINQRLLNHVHDVFKPDAVVCQVGADGLNEDPMHSFNLTTKGLANCVNHVLSWNLPTLILGGGGYHDTNVARCWCSITSAILKFSPQTDIPEHDLYSLYGPIFEFEISKGLRKDCNTAEYLNLIANTVIDNINKIS